jgi:hypothetical protein
VGDSVEEGLLEITLHRDNGTYLCAVGRQRLSDRSTRRHHSAEEKIRIVLALRISRTVFSALSAMRLLACLIVSHQTKDHRAKTPPAQQAIAA